MRELVHLILGEPCLLPALDPRPGPDVGDGVLALAFAGEVVTRLASVFAGEVDLKDAVDAEGLVTEAVYRIYVKNFRGGMGQ